MIIRLQIRDPDADAIATYRIADSSDFADLVHRVITKHLNAAAAHNRQNLSQNDEPGQRSWDGLIDGRAFRITELPPTGRRPPMALRSLRVDEPTWSAAQHAADERGEILSEQIRHFLERYSHTGPH